MILVHPVTSLVSAYVLLSFFEYAGHRWLLHKMLIAKRSGSEWLRRMCFNHTALHHKKPYLHTRHEQDDDPLQLLVSGAVVGLAISLPIYFFIDPLTVKLLMVLGPIYAVTMYKVHKHMHLQADSNKAGGALFRWLDSRHRLHHLFPNRNLNVILPLFDWVFGTALTA
jgi:hypothetical protein